MSVHCVLVDGALLQIQVGTTWIVKRRACDCHVVNLGPAFFMEARCGSSGNHSVGLCFGGTAILNFTALPKTPEYEVFTLLFAPIGPTLNLTERVFASEVRHVLKATADHQHQSSDYIEGAAPVNAIASKCSARRPTHTSEMITSLSDVNSFEGACGEKLCVAKKRSKPRSLHARCPRVEQPAGIDTIARRAANGEALWRQCAASFSTMMRHFQKSPSTFKWESDAEKRTIITKTVSAPCSS